MEKLVFAFLFVLTIGSACIVAFSRNLIYSAFALMGTFLGVAGTFVFLTADFMGLAQVVVYAGGILVLVIFAVMLSAKIGIAAKTNPVMNVKAVVPLMLVLVALLSVVVSSKEWVSDRWMQAQQLSQMPVVSSIDELGKALLNEYLLPFELISVLLLLTMIGAAIITRKMVK